MKIRRKIRQSLPIKRTFDAHSIGLPRQGPNFSRKSAGQITMAPSFSEVTPFFWSNCARENFLYFCSHQNRSNSWLTLKYLHVIPKKILGFDWICFTANKTESLKNQMPEKSIPLAVNVDFPFVERQAVACHTNMMILITRKYSKGREKKNQKRILSISSLRDKVISPYFHRFFHVNHPF